MPTWSAAASRQPDTNNEPRSTHRFGRFGRLGALALVLPIAASFAAAQPAPVAARAGQNCSSWNSLSRPPDSIRVLRVQTGRIETVNFRKYVVTVMGKEWPSYLPFPVVEAGAIAVKQYGWYHAVYSNRSYNGRCFDVKDSTGDQLYKPNRARIRPDHYRALDSTWNVSLRKQGRFFMTGYRRGAKVNCGRDVTGYKLFARSATDCARRGHGWRELVRKYYGPGLVIIGSGGNNSSSASDAQAPDAQAPDTSARPSNNESNAGEQQSSGGAVRLSNGRWVDQPTTRPEAIVNAGLGGSAVGGLGDALPTPTVPIVPTVPSGPFQRLVVNPLLIV